MDILLYLAVGVWTVFTVVAILVIARLLDDRQAAREQRDRDARAAMRHDWYYRSTWTPSRGDITPRPEHYNPRANRDKEL